MEIAECPGENSIVINCFPCCRFCLLGFLASRHPPSPASSRPGSPMACSPSQEGRWSGRNYKHFVLCPCCALFPHSYFHPPRLLFVPFAGSTRGCVISVGRVIASIIRISSPPSTDLSFSQMGLLMSTITIIRSAARVSPYLLYVGVAIHLIQSTSECESPAHLYSKTDAQFLLCSEAQASSSCPSLSSSSS